jgi:hypothetical protein
MITVLFDKKRRGLVNKFVKKRTYHTHTIYTKKNTPKEVCW